MAARLAAKMGYTNVKVFHAGAPAWQKEGKPLLTSHDFISERLDSVILIDSRSPEEAAKGHIQGAFAIALSQLTRERDQLPLDTKVPVIIYGQDTGLGEIAPIIEELALMVDHKFFILENGYAGWVKTGGPIQSGKIRTKIVYLPKPGPGEIVGDEFLNIVKSKPEDKIILDVRTAEERADGKIEWARNIPVDDLPGQIGSLPKNKEIIVHCGTGMRAQMAYSALVNAGFKTRFLNDKIAFIKNQPVCCYKE
ncbi:MAG: rhodanese-like domain-containing protein [Thermodesulfobacteriota bacterium]